MNLLSSLLAFTARQIGALRTQADSNTSRIETSEGNITDLTTTVNNTIVANSNSKEQLWSGELHDGTATLSKNISNFDFIDIEYKQAVSGSVTNKTITKRIPAVAGSYEINDFAVDYTVPSIDFYNQTLTLSATSLVAAQNYDVTGVGGSDTWNKQRGTYQFAIVRVLGVKLGSASPSELTDIRVGADGVTYNSAGAAVRGQLSDLKSNYSELKEYVGVKDYGLLSGYVFEKASGNTTVTVVDTQTGVQLTKSDAVNANCRFRPTSWVKGQYNVKGSFSSGSITQLGVYENGSLITTVSVIDKEFAFAYEWDGSKRVQFGFQYPYNVGTLLFELNVYDAVSLTDKIDNIDDIPFIIGGTNTFFGVGAGENTSENEVDEPDDGRYNAAFGTEAMKANTTGDHCTAVGYKALAKNTSGDSNTGVGEDALYENTTGEYNVAVGGHALQNNNGSSNTAVGSNAGRNVSTGTGNVIIGSQTGQNVIGGSQNVLIGSYVGQGAGDYSDTVVIGNDINPSANHQMKIGGSNITSFVVRMNNKNMLISFNQDGTITWSQL